ncbi:MAG: hypothetical protein WD939_10540, partial [Dehalococcoidia bacterium]
CTYSLRGPAFDELWGALDGSSPAEVGDGHPLFQEIRRHGAARELSLVVATLQALASGRVRIERGRVVDDSGRELPGGLDLTSEVDADVAQELAD